MPETRPEDLELQQEQQYVSMLYEQLDARRREAWERLAEVERLPTTGTDQGKSERDSLGQHYSTRITQLNSVEQGLCFGRIDRTDGNQFYIGRIGLSDDEHELLLVDWRAPVARSFYRATAAAPDGIVRRRHLRTRNRAVVGIDDDLLDDEAVTDRGSLIGEAALLASLRAERTGRLTDIVATIQAEQDRAIRTDLPGILVVQGGPGTGKTVVALHRVAYLLYAHRDRLGSRGVLVIGPNATFMRYIEQVLPSLGETDVVLSTVGQLCPGITPTRTESLQSAAVKGDLRMAEVLAAAVADRQELPDGPIDFVVDDEKLTLSPETCRRARARARRARQPDSRAPLQHNRARHVFARVVVAELAEEWATAFGGVLDEEISAELRDELRSSAGLTAILDRLWPVLTPEQLLADLFASPERMAAAGLSETDAGLLLRTGSGWTPADVPLLDEAAELLGDDGLEEAQVASRRQAEEKAELEYAEGVMQIFGLSDPDPVVQAKRVELFARRYQGATQHGPTARRAAVDRSWAFGHVVVDEAQECSPMDWRAIMRRCPSRSMTIVGDFAQAGTPAAPRSWSDALDRYAAGNWQVRELTVNYRTPASIMVVAARVLAAVRPDLRPPQSVRDGEPPWQLRVEPAELAQRVSEAAGAERAVIGDGQLAVIAPAARCETLRRLLGPDVHPVGAVKGLEFDAVIVVEPEEIWRESPCGGNDLYVALTRSTRRLGIVHSGPLSAVFDEERL